jgi:hypothetical protein
MLKIMSDKVEKAILIVPFWPAQNWFSLLNSNLITLADSVEIPLSSNAFLRQHKRLNSVSFSKGVPLLNVA